MSHEIDPQSREGAIRFFNNCKAYAEDMLKRRKHVFPHAQIYGLRRPNTQSEVTGMAAELVVGKEEMGAWKEDQPGVAHYMFEKMDGDQDKNEIALFLREQAVKSNAFAIAWTSEMWGLFRKTAPDATKEQINEIRRNVPKDLSQAEDRMEALLVMAQHRVYGMAYFTARMMRVDDNVILSPWEENSKAVHGDSWETTGRFAYMLAPMTPTAASLHQYVDAISNCGLSLPEAAAVAARLLRVNFVENLTVEQQNEAMRDIEKVHSEAKKQHEEKSKE